MADAKISQLPVATTPLAGTELVPLVQGGVNVQSTVDKVLTGTVPSGTANGVLFLNGSKVVTSGSALTFDGTQFRVVASTPASSTSLISSGTFGVRLGANSTNGALIEGVDSTGATSYQPLYIGGLDLRFTLSGSEQMRLTSTGLGIGTSSPSNKLEVSGAAAFSRIGFNTNAIDVVSTAQSFVRFQSTGGDFYVGTESGTGGVFFPSSTAYAAILYNANATPMQFYTAGSLRATLDSSGNLGLGVTPSAWSAGIKVIEFGSIGGLAAATIDVNMLYNVYYDGVDRYRTNGYASNFQQQQGAFKWLTAPSGTAGNAISFTQAMTLDASGNLGVGITNPGYRLDVSIASGPYSARFNNTSTSTSDYNVVAIGQGASGSAVGYFGTGGSAVGNAAFANSFVVGTQTSSALVFNTADTERARIPAAGGMVVGTAALATSATDGFLYVPTCAGTPTGTPTTQTGTAPIVVDTTNNKLYFYSGGQWRDAGP